MLDDVAGFGEEVLILAEGGVRLEGGVFGVDAGDVVIFELDNAAWDKIAVDYVRMGSDEWMDLKQMTGYVFGWHGFRHIR